MRAIIEYLKKTGMGVTDFALHVSKFGKRVATPTAYAWIEGTRKPDDDMRAQVSEACRDRITGEDHIPVGSWLEPVKPGALPEAKLPRRRRFSGYRGPADHVTDPVPLRRRDCVAYEPVLFSQETIYPTPETLRASLQLALARERDADPTLSVPAIIARHLLAGAGASVAARGVFLSFNFDALAEAVKTIT